MSVETIFAAASQKPASERAAYLVEVCGGDAELRRKVERLLKAHDAAGGFLEEPAAPDRTGAYSEIAETVGSKIGPYVLREQIGEGGFGLVFVAEQTEPVKRKVALKVIKPGMDSRQVIARFEAERQALAMMDHPNIARVLDAGATESGRPYFVMELVRGIPITEYCDKNQLAPKERLELFVTVCQAIQHAHQKGIIHRDVKPSNVLVTSHDGKPVAKVIDFGVAKAVHQQLTDRSIYTNFATMVGTPLYMSPEQAEMSGLDIDTRSDIYSLGVLLYELLTGTTPLDRKKFAQAAYDEVRRLIREEEPPKPSTRLSSTESIASIAAQRHMEPAKLSKFMRGDLDWITMKCLEKDRTRRYETANGIARDIQRYLCDEPVEASPPSATYRLRKFAKKNRAALSTAAAIVLLLVAGVTVSAWLAVRATRAEADARAAAEAERHAKQEAVEKRQDAETSAAAERQANEQSKKRLVQIEKGNEILTSIFADLDIRNVKAGTEPLEAVLAKRLVSAAEQLGGESVGDPVVVAELQQKLGLSLVNLGHPQGAVGLYQKARDTFASAKGATHPDTLVTMGSLALAYQRIGKINLALPLYEETDRLMQAHLGANHPETIRNMMHLAACYGVSGHAARGVPLCEAVVRYRKARLGPDHTDTLASMHNLAMCYQAAGQPDLALLLAEETMKLRKARLGADHSDSLVSLNGLAFIHWRAQRLDRAIPLFEESLKLHKSKMGSDHPRTITAMNNLASGYRNAGQPDLALPLFEQAAVEVEKRHFQLEDAERIIDNLIDCCERLQRFDKAETWHRKWLAVVKERTGNDSQPTADVLVYLGLSLLKQKKWGEAETVLRECLAIRERRTPGDWRTFYTQTMLGESLMGQKKYADAEPRLIKSYEGMKAREKTIPPQGATRIPEAIDRLVELYTAMNKPDEAKKWRAERAKYKETAPPPRKRP